MQGSITNPRGNTPAERNAAASPFFQQVLSEELGWVFTPSPHALGRLVPGHQSLPQPLTLPHESGEQGGDGTEDGHLGNPHHRIPESQCDALDEPPGKHDELAQDGDAADLSVQLRLQSSGAHHLCELAQHGDDGQDENDTDEMDDEHNSSSLKLVYKTEVQ